MKRKKKTVNVLRFAVCRKGYDIEAVESYLATEKLKAEDIQLEQRERIAALKAECDRLNVEVCELKGREEQIKAALISATQNAQRLTADVKAKYAMELERLSLFRAKWQNTYQQLKDRYHFDKDALNMESVALTTQIELKKFLEQDFSLNRGDEQDPMEAHFRSEVERLTKQQIEAQGAVNGGFELLTKEQQSGVCELKQRIKEAEDKKNQKAKREELKSESAFSLEEALNPKESLEDICRYLGLNRQ